MPFRTLTQIVVGLILALVISTFVLLPSVYIDSFIEPSITSRFIFLGYAVTIVGVLSFPFLLLSRHAIPVSISLVDVFVMTMCLYIVIDRYFIHPNHGFSIRFIELFQMMVWYLLLRCLPVWHYPFLLLGIIAGGFLQVFEGILQLAGMINSHHADFPITGSFFNPGGYAGYLSLITVLSFGMYLNRNSLISQLPPKVKSLSGRLFPALFTYLPIVVFVSCLIILPGLRSRSSWLSVLAGVGLIGIKYKRQQGPFNISVKRLLLISAVLLSAVFFFYQFKKDSANGRLLIYKVSMKMVMAHPFFGVGFDGFKTHYMAEQAKWFERIGMNESPDHILADNTFYAFNEPLQLLVENGIVVFLLILVSLVLYKRFSFPIREKAIFRTLSFSLLLGCFVFGLFTYMSDNLPMRMIAVFAFAMLAKSENNIFSTNMQFVSKRYGLVAISLICGVFVSWYSFRTIEKLRSGFYAWREAEAFYLSGYYSESVVKFGSVYPQFQRNGEYLMQYAKSLSMTGNDALALQMLQQAKYFLSSCIIETAMGDCERKLGNYINAEKSYVNAMYMIPNRFYPFYLLMTLYNETGQKIKALEMAKAIESKKVKIPSKAIREIKGFAHELIKTGTLNNH
ncbi:O-antigen ligase family protein [Niastella sp. MAH-29]|uniref:O-antigen ligase family protein n=1 Tax=Niastella soli TaxID=2821487 RepID=A0ABS3Z0Z8_9BACT|nr:O-antigen ligase family protein [Niastella soli]MBO9203841.1 O-antigen ligase family protein [Niastella soli]